MNTQMEALFRATGILELQSAARLAGLRYRNGEFSKNTLIAHLLQHPSIGGAAYDVLMRQGQKIPAPAPETSDWFDDEDEAPQAPASGLEKAPASESVPQPTQAIDLSAYWTKRDQTAYKTEVVEAMNRQRAARVAVEEGLRQRVGALERNAPIAFQIAGKATIAPVAGLAHAQLPFLIQILAAGEQAMLVGPAASGKTTAALQASEVLAKLFEREDYGLEASGAIGNAFELLGFIDGFGKYRETAFRRAVEFGHTFLFDEIDASDNNATLVINSLDNGFVMFPDRKVPLHPHFRIIAGANTDGSGPSMAYAGRIPMDGAFRDRFAILDWELDPRIEAHLSRGDDQWLKAVQAIRAYAVQHEILDVIATARAVRRGPLFLAQGMPRATALETTCKRGAIRESWEAITRLPAVASFLKG